MRAALLLAGKDLRQRLRDRSAYLFGFVAPFGLAAVFSLILGDLGTGLGSISYVVYDGDRGTVSRAFVDEALAGFASASGASVDEVGAASDAIAMVESGEASAAFVIPAGFTESVMAARPTELSVVGNIDAPISTQIAQSVAESFTRQISRSQVSIGTLAAMGELPADPASVGAVQQAAVAYPAPVTVTSGTTAVRQLDATTYYAAGMTVFFMFFVVQIGIAGFLEERRLGTMSRLLAAPIPFWAIVGGKALAAFFLGALSMTTLMITSAILLGAQWGPPLGVALLVVAGVASAVALMAVIATFTNTPEQAGTIQAIVAVVLGMLGGAFFPVPTGSELLATLSLLTPHAWFLRGLAEIAGGGAADVLPAVGALLTFAAVAWAVALMRMRKLVAT